MSPPTPNRKSYLIALSGIGDETCGQTDGRMDTAFLDAFWTENA